MPLYTYIKTIMEMKAINIAKKPAPFGHSSHGPPSLRLPTCKLVTMFSSQTFRVTCLCVVHLALFVVFLVGFSEPDWFHDSDMYMTGIWQRCSLHRRTVCVQVIDVNRISFLHPSGVLCNVILVDSKYFLWVPFHKMYSLNIIELLWSKKEGLYN